MAATLSSDVPAAAPCPETARVAGLDALDHAGWYACHTRARAEKRVDAQLAERGIESYLPAVPCRHRWSDRNATVLVPLFTSYVFARGEALGPIVEIPGVYDVVHFSGRPALIPDREIRNIRRFVQALTTTRHDAPRVTFRQGERVRITAGPFEGVEGVVMRSKNRCRVLVGLAAIGAGFELDVPARSVLAI